ncbi:hypothetical protein PY365_25370 [Roseiarcaceae bacterium H3SJ34-1]|uniref:hypothetical protein n=1 Tax=Terripilifer ovatus TaxID=3032367 RepID=UPI003AB9227B|nr:hypothetical protein [Roseiarcaceae bacterium H3SJ34-1]
MPQPALPARMMGALFAVAFLAGCAKGGSDPADIIGNLAARGAFGGSPPAAAQAATPSETNVICPSVEVKDGSAAYRVYAGAQTSENVRYQYSLGDIARECRVAGGQVLIKVGVEGKVLLGPAGQPSNFNVPVFVGVRAEAGEKMLVSKVYNAAVTIPAGQTQGSFAIVSDELAVPFTQENANDDYTVFVGFEGPGKAPVQRTARARRQRH